MIIGMLIADRYEVLEKIGTGGMSDVYKAKDHKLNRFVAVKVLKQEFSENANFVSKFRVEAQAAAGLMHPNVVNVYDVGQEEGIYYIVMELVEGITLKKYIEKKARLSFREATSIAIQVCMGIEAAHNNHIIHRDIKPQNVIISKEGKVKVTDFGIAKAATSNTITSNVMGSVHYTSPEQARGGYSDEKSDIYSLGITLFEMLTGRVPFNGETTVAIAIKHIQEEMPSPCDFVAEIPLSIESIVLKCCQKSPDRRYQSMGDLIKDLKYALMNPDEDFVKIDLNDEAGATKVLVDSDARAKRPNRERDYVDDSVSIRTERDSRGKKTSVTAPMRSGQYDDEYYEDEYDDYGEYDDEYDDEYEEYYEDEPKAPQKTSKKRQPVKKKKKKKASKTENITTILAIIIAMFVGLVVIFLIARVIKGLDFEGQRDEFEIISNKEQVEMPVAEGKPADSVKKELIELGLTPEIEYEESSEYEEGIVIRSSVTPGTMVDEGTNIVLTVSAGEKGTGVEIPDVVGMSEAEAVSTLVNKGFVPSKLDGYDDYIQAGSIYKQSPEANTFAPAGATINIFISKGPEETKVQVPKLLGQDEVTAMAMLKEHGLELGTVTEVNHDDPALSGLVCNQSIAADEWVSSGTKVDISVSIGPTQSTYKFNDTISAPDINEDPKFRPGTTVTVSMIADDGTVLLSTQTDSFPISQLNITGIKSSSGVIVFQYVNQGESSTITNEDGSIVTVDALPEDKEVKRIVEFVAE